MGHIHKILRVRFSRFLIIGAINTSINFIVLNLAVSGLHLNKIAASILATSFAIVFSFVFNRSFVFSDKSEPAKRFARFSAVAVVGTLLIQTSVYSAYLYILGKEHWISGNVTQINTSNLFASICVTLWNYNGYRLFVFKDKKQSDELVEETGPETA